MPSVDLFSRNVGLLGLPISSAFMLKITHKTIRNVAL